MAKRGGSTTKRPGLSGQALKDFRRDVAALKKKGIVSAKVDARSQKATRYMRSKVRKYSDVLSGTAIAIKAPKDVRTKYTDKGVLEARGSFLIAQREFENQRARLRKGLVEVHRPLKNGREEYVILPFRPVDMPDLVRKLREDPTLDGLKNPEDMFAFRLFGHNSMEGFVDIDELAEYIELRYRHLFDGKSSVEAVKHITFQRFKQRPGWTPANEYASPLSNPNSSREPKLDLYMPRKIDAKGRNTGEVAAWRKKRDANRQAKRRSEETPEQTSARQKRDREAKARKKTK